MPGAASVLAEAGVFTSMRQGEVIEDPEERVVVGSSGDKVVMDVREFLTSPEVFGETERGMFVLGHRQEEGWGSG